MQSNNLKLKILNFALLFFVFSFTLYVSLVEAATIDFAVLGEPTVGKTVSVTILIKPAGESINAVEGTLDWPERQLELTEVKEDQSLVSIWIRPPRLATDGDGRLPFAGIIPGGYAEPAGELFSLVFRARSAGLAPITFSAARALINDGEGTAASLEIKNLLLEIKPARGKRFLAPVLFFFGLGIILIIILCRFVFSRSYR
ncbi:MAG: hypothetical protein HYT46_03000 [Candidatus Vogelbacteria bacterium]|nr:hypothetical protein [Candidatus Vogelbacteria bacterium]